MEPKKQQDMDDITRQLREIEPVEPSVFLYAKILHKIEGRKDLSRKISPQFVWRLAVVFVLLVMVNVYVLFTSPQEYSQETITLVEELGLGSDTYFDNY